MPDIDGFEVCRRIRAEPDWAQIPIIFLSSADDKGQIVRALESVVVDYITKPFNQADLVSRVRTHLPRSSELHGKSRSSTSRRSSTNTTSR